MAVVSNTQVPIVCLRLNPRSIHARLAAIAGGHMRNMGMTCAHTTLVWRISPKGLYQHRSKVPSRVLTGSPVSKAWVGVRPVTEGVSGSFSLWQPNRRRAGDSTEMHTMGHSM